MVFVFDSLGMHRMHQNRINCVTSAKVYKMNDDFASRRLLFSTLCSQFNHRTPNASVLTSLSSIGTNTILDVPSRLSIHDSPSVRLFKAGLITITKVSVCRVSFLSRMTFVDLLFFLQKEVLIIPVETTICQSS